MIQIKEEIMREGFVKHHLLNLGFDAVIHQLDSKDLDVIHDHPFNFTSFILNGSYIERIWTKDSVHNLWWYKEYLRKQGTSNYVEATTIHQIVEFPDGICTTLILPENKTNEWSTYEYRNVEGMWRKQHNKKSWLKLDNNYSHSPEY